MNRLFKNEYYIHCYETNKIRKNNILFVSKGSEDIVANIFYLLLELSKKQYSDYKIYFACNKEKKENVRRIFVEYGIENVAIIGNKQKKYYKLLASVEYLFTDSFFDLSYIKKEGQTVVGMWSASSFGLVGESLSKYEAKCTIEYGNIQKNIALADYIIAPNGFEIIEKIEEYGAKNLSLGKILCIDENGINENVFYVSVCDRIFFGHGDCKDFEIKDNDKENVIIYVSELQLNGLTSALINLLNNLDREKKNYFAVVLTEEINDCTERIKKLPDGVEVIPISIWPITKLYEYIALKLFYKLNFKSRSIMKIVDKVYEREARRYFGGFVYNHVIQYIGYQRDVINLFGKMHGNRTIFVHNDMIQELKFKDNQHELTLRKAYAEYDHVAAVSKDIYPTLFELGATERNAAIVNNCIDYKGIYERGFGEIEFEESTVSNVSIENLKEILDGTSTKFINIARFSPEKGHIMLIDAFEKYYKNDSDSYLIIIGGYGNAYDDVCAHVMEMESKEHIILIKGVQNPMPILKRCDLFILSSIYEGLGLVLLEAIIQGVPVMSTDVVGPRGFMQENGGYLVEADAEGLYKGMCEFATNGIKPLCVNFEEYNKKAVQEFENLITIA